MNRLKSFKNYLTSSTTTTTGSVNNNIQHSPEVIASFTSKHSLRKSSVDSMVFNSNDVVNYDIHFFFDLIYIYMDGLFSFALSIRVIHKAAAVCKREIENFRTISYCLGLMIRVLLK